MFGRRSRRESESPDNPYYGLRRQLLNTDPKSVGITPSARLPRVWGAAIEMTYPNGTATVFGLADGTTSMYTSTGGGVIGGGGYESVAQSTSEWLALTETMLDLLPVDSDTGLPPTNCVTLRAFTYEGHRAVTVAEDDLGHGWHPASPLFHAAHRVISELRLIDKQHR